MFIRNFFLGIIFSWLFLFGINQFNWIQWSIFDPEFGMWTAKSKLIEDAYGKKGIVILGDSRIMAAYHPNKNSNQINLALGGGTPVEAYFILERLINKSTEIDKLILSFSPSHFEEQDVFLDRAILFNFYKKDEFNRLIVKSSNGKLFGRNIVSIYSCWLKTPNCLMPYYFSGISSTIASIATNSKNKNSVIYEETESERGWHLFGLTTPNDKPIEYYRRENQFNPDPLINFYFLKLLELAKEHNIPVFFYISPIENSVGESMQGHRYLEEFNTYLKLQSLEMKIYFGKGVPLNFIGDGSHVNKVGSEATTSYINRMIINENK